MTDLPSFADQTDFENASRLRADDEDPVVTP
jgi:hypothetical protein